MIKKDRKVVLAMISQFSDALKVIDKSYLKDAEIIHLAIQKHGSAFQYAPEEFRKNIDVIKLAGSDALPFISKRKAIELLSFAGHILFEAPPSIQRCKACVMSAVGNHGLVLQHASFKLRMNTEVVRAAVQNDGLALEFVEGTLNDNANIVNLVVGKMVWHYNMHHQG